MSTIHSAARPVDYDAPRPRRLGDTDRLAVILAESFGFDAAGAAEWLRGTGASNWRSLRSGDETALAWLLVVRAGLHFGGREVSAAGIAAVCAPAEHRGQGAARRLLERTLLELHAAGDALALLHPVMNELYRRVGFEPAGSRWRATARLVDVRLAARSPSIRQVAPADAAVVRRLYAERAASQPGFLARSDYLWSRLQTARTETRRGDLPPVGYLLEGDDGPEGYLYVAQSPRAGGRFDLRVTDLVVRTAAAARRVAAFLGSFSTFGDDVHLWTGPGDPFFQALPECPFRFEACKPWMLRVVDVARALSQRGYPPGLDATVHLHVTDALIPDNDGPWVLRVSGGRGEASRGGHGTVRMDVRGLAALFTGYMSPEALQVAGLVAGDRAELAALGAVFAGPAPWMPDGF